MTILYYMNVKNATQTFKTIYAQAFFEKYEKNAHNKFNLRVRIEKYLSPRKKRAFHTFLAFQCVIRDIFRHFKYVFGLNKAFMLHNIALSKNAKPTYIYIFYH